VEVCIIEIPESWKKSNLKKCLIKIVESWFEQNVNMHSIQSLFACRRIQKASTVHRTSIIQRNSAKKNNRKHSTQITSQNTTHASAFLVLKPLDLCESIVTFGNSQRRAFQSSGFIESGMFVTAVVTTEEKRIVSFAKDTEGGFCSPSHEGNRAIQCALLEGR
jgi:hypothetical protein